LSEAEQFHCCLSLTFSNLLIYVRAGQYRQRSASCEGTSEQGKLEAMIQAQRVMKKDQLPWKFMNHDEKIVSFSEKDWDNLFPLLSAFVKFVLFLQSWRRTPATFYLKRRIFKNEKMSL